MPQIGGNNWVNFAALGARLPQHNAVVIPAFNEASAFNDASVILAEFPVGNTEEFAFRYPIDPAIDNETCIIAVRYVPEDGFAVRYILKNNANGLLHAPEYAGQTLGVGAIIEIWDISGVSAAESSVGITLYVSDLTKPSNCVGGCTTIVPTTTTLTQTTPIILPIGDPDNPFSVEYETP